MTYKHTLLIILVVLLWGGNFSVIKIGLADFPPLLLLAIRFFLVVFPAIFFVKMPKANWPLIILYALTMFVMQFFFLFTSIDVGLTPGLASILLQSQIFFTVVLSSLVFKEKIKNNHIWGGVICLIGITIIGINIDNTLSAYGFLFIILAAFSWSVANIFSKLITIKDIVSLIVWGSLISFPVVLFMSYQYEVDAWKTFDIKNLSILSVFAVSYLSYPVTIFAFSVWSYMLNKYNAIVVTPFTLLVPVFGLIISSFVNGEIIESWKILSIIIIMFGLIIIIKPSKF